jgi:hypothetical protein
MRKNLLKYGLWALAVVMMAIGTYLGLKAYLVSFRLSNISLELPFENEWKIPELSEEERKRVLALLDQPYVYLGQGKQVYAFQSQDGEYVIKFFKFGHLKPGKWLLNADEEQAKIRRIKRIFNAHFIAYRYDRQNAGLIYAHLDRSHPLKKEIQVTDRYGWTHRIPLDETYFVLQQKGMPLGKILDGALKSGNVELGKEKLRRVLAMYLSEYPKGIFDQDHNIMHNIGFADDHPIRLDVGRIERDPTYAKPTFMEQDLEKIIDTRIAVWLGKHYPQYRESIVQTLKSEFLKNNQLTRSFYD